RWRAGASVTVTPGAGDERRAARRQTLQIRRVHLDAVDRQETSVEEAAVVQELHRCAARRHPLRIPRPEFLEHRPPRSTAAADELHFLCGFRQVDAAGGKRIAIDRLADR